MSAIVELFIIVLVSVNSGDKKWPVMFEEMLEESPLFLIKSDLILQIRQLRETHQMRRLWANLDKI